MNHDQHVVVRIYRPSFKANLAGLTPLQSHFMGRLYHLETLRIRANQLSEGKNRSLLRNMIDRALASTWLDCQAQGLIQEASDLLDQLREDAKSQAGQK